MSKTILITGGNRGIGRGLVEHLAAEHQVIFSVRTKEDGEATLEKLNTQQKNASYVILDVTDDESIKRAISDIDANTPVDILINNAGILPDYQTPTLDADIETILTTFQTNTLGPLRVCRAVVPMMKEGGRILNISSGMGQLSDMGRGAIAYRLSKTSLNALTRVLANELAPNGISVNCICPGWVQTDMGGPNATRTINDSVSKIVELVLSDSYPTGQFLRDGQPIPW